jgi:hypothetical protein
MSDEEEPSVDADQYEDETPVKRTVIEKSEDE